MKTRHRLTVPDAPRQRGVPYSLLNVLCLVVRQRYRETSNPKIMRRYVL
jgi:hypothetical protein